MGPTRTYANRKKNRNAILDSPGPAQTPAAARASTSPRLADASNQTRFSRPAHSPSGSRTQPRTRGRLFDVYIDAEPVPITEPIPPHQGTARSSHPARPRPRKRKENLTRNYVYVSPSHNTPSRSAYSHTVHTPSHSVRPSLPLRPKTPNAPGVSNLILPPELRRPRQTDKSFSIVRRASQTNALVLASSGPSLNERLLDVTSRSFSLSPRDTSTPHGNRAANAIPRTFQVFERSSIGDMLPAHELDSDSPLPGTPTPTKPKQKKQKEPEDNLSSSIAPSTSAASKVSNITRRRRSVATSNMSLSSLAEPAESYVAASSMTLSSLAEPAGNSVSPTPPLLDEGTLTADPNLSSLQPALSLSQIVSRSIGHNTATSRDSITGSRATRQTDSIFGRSTITGPPSRRVSFAPEVEMDDGTHPSHQPSLSSALPRQSFLKSRYASSLPGPAAQERRSKPPSLNEPEPAGSSPPPPSSPDPFDCLPPRKSRTDEYVRPRGPTWSKFLNRELTPSDEERDDVLLVSRPAVLFLSARDYDAWCCEREKRPKTDSSPVCVYVPKEFEEGVLRSG